MTTHRDGPPTVTTTLVIERHLVDPGRGETYGAALVALLAAMRTVDGLLWADAARSIGEPDLVTVASEWRTAANAATFLEGAAYTTFRETVDVCLREDASRRLFAGTNGSDGSA